ncbi:MAG TPA: serine/threonine-protein kinase [Gemmataceae bacterium]|nr:serine/threonine-protein kinase [Gemmataceae bacterium]
MPTEPQPSQPHAEDEAFSLLETYTQGLQAGRPVDKKQILAEHPELAATVACLDALALLAPSIPANGPEHAEADRPTVSGSGRPGAGEFADPVAPATKDFGNYELLEEIGRGGMGVVYKARQKDLDRVVALKMILSSNFASPDQIRRFHIESRTAARLHHANMVQIYEAGQVHGQYYFAMEYVEGTSLAALLREGPLPVDMAASYLAALARGVAHLHAEGIVHRDLKPGNILLQASSTKSTKEHVDQKPVKQRAVSLRAPSCSLADKYIPKITDFGLVKLLEAETQVTSTGAIIGTPSYMAPEQAAGRADVGPLCDVYSLGAILYEVLTGRPPFHGETPLDTLVQVLEGEATLPKQLRREIPRELELICLKCLDKNPALRYPSAQALADDLERFQRGETVEARPRGLVQGLARWSRREPALLAHLAVLAVCIMVLHIYYVVAHQVPPALHLTVLGVLALWGVVSVVCQACLRREWSPDLVRTLWLSADGVLMTVAFGLGEALTSPILVCYALFIAASGLWFRVRLVWLTTILSIAGYLFLVLAAGLRGQEAGARHHQVLFMVALAALGLVVAYQVQRVRVLSRYYDHRPLA